MADRKKSTLSIVLRTVDNASAQFRQFNERVAKAISRTTAPFRRLSNRLKVLGREGGLTRIAEGFAGVKKAALGLKDTIFGVGIAAGVAAAGLVRMVESGDKLAKTADRLGVTIDELAQLRFAAKQSGVEVEQFDSAMETFSKNLGQARTGTGRMAAFLKKAGAPFLKQLKTAKSTGEAFELMAKAIVKVKDPAKRAALATAAFGDADITSLLKEGPEGIKKLREEYFQLAGSQEEGARRAEEMDDAMGRMGAMFDRIKAGALTKLAPAVMAFGEWLPGAIQKTMAILRSLIDRIRPVWEAIGGLKGAAITLSVILGGKLVLAIAALGKAMLTTPFGLFAVGIAGLVSAGLELAENWNLVWEFFEEMWNSIVAKFEWALGKITAVMDKVAAPVRWLGGVHSSIVNSIVSDSTGPSVQRGVAGIRENMQATRAQAHVTVDFANAPKGTRAAADPRSSASVDLSMGYQLVTP